VFALKGVVDGQVLDSGLKQGELIGDKRVRVDEMITILKVPVGLGTVGKIKQGLKIIGLFVVDI
jgi:hypothetical protein